MIEPNTVIFITRTDPQCTLFCAQLFDFERAGLFGERNELGAAKKEPHPSITRVDKGGLHNTKLDVPSQTFFSLQPTAARAQEADCPGELSPSGTLSLLSSLERFFGIYSQLKVAAVVGASALKLEHKAGGRGRESQRNRGSKEGEREREREERSPVPLSDAGRFEERT